MKINKKYSLILSLVDFLYSCFLLTIPVLSSELVDAAIKASSSSNSYNNLFTYIVAITAAIILDIFLYLLEGILYFRFSIRREKEIKEQLFYQLFKNEYSDISKYHTASIEQLFTTDIQHIIREELETIPNFVRQLTRLILAVAIVIAIDYWFLALILGCGILGFVLAKIYSRLIRPIHQRVLENAGKTNGYILEAVSQMKLIKVYDSSKYSNSYFDELNNNELASKRKRNRLIFLANGGLFTFSSLVYLFALVYGAYGIGTNILTYGSMIALIQLLNNIQTPLISFSSLWNQHNLARTSQKRIENIYSLKEEVIANSPSDFDSIAFENVTFAYFDEPVIKNLSFEAKRNDIVLLQGASGIGKTTIFMLLMGFLKPQSGEIYMKYKNEKYPVCRNLFSYVPQENILFSGTILDNIYILTGKGEAEAIEALKIANIYDELLDLPFGLNTILKERGNGLSLGQIQRIWIAIAILADKPILLLDEFSSALDSENEGIIMDRLAKLNKTIIYISHRDRGMDNQKIISLGEDKNAADN